MSDNEPLSEQIARRVVSLLAETGVDSDDVLGFVAVLSDGTPALYVDSGLARTALIGAMELAKDELLCLAQGLSDVEMMDDE